MKVKLIKEGLANMERLRKMVALAEEASPALKRRGEKFRSRLAKRQDRETKRILSRPGSKAYRDYMATPV